MIEAKVVHPLVDPSDPTTLYQYGQPTNTSVFCCYCVALMSVSGLPTLCSPCSRLGCRNATQWHRFKARVRCRPCGLHGGGGGSRSETP